jgi:hypothetical protein
MLKTVAREIALAIQARSGMSLAVAIWTGVVGIAVFAAFVFLCVAGYAWLSPRYGSDIAGLIMAGIFTTIAVISAIVAAIIRRRVRERALLARAAKSQTPPWLLDPRVVGAAVEAGRSLGWRRLIPIALVGFMAAQWARERRHPGDKRHF